MYVRVCYTTHPGLVSPEDGFILGAGHGLRYKKESEQYHHCLGQLLTSERGRHYYMHPLYWLGLYGMFKVLLHPTFELIGP